MRCPKCGFVSYDLTETCGKCGKNISGASKALQGTVASVGAPGFLRVAIVEPDLDAARGGETEAEVTFDLGADEETVIDLGGDEGPSLEAGSLDLGMEEAAVEPVELGSFEEPAAEEPVFAMPTEEPEAAGFEISDLAPPQEIAGMAEEEAAEEPEFAAAEATPSKPQSTGLGLADLKVEGIDLEVAPAKGKAMPSVKTGTALDEFDIDLGELIPKKK